MKPVRASVRDAPQGYWGPQPKGGFEPGDGWTSSLGFDTGVFLEGTRSALLRKGGTLFWQDFANPLDLSLSTGFRVWSYWAPPAGFWWGNLQLNMLDTSFNSYNHAGFKQDAYRNFGGPFFVTDTYLNWGAVTFTFPGDIPVPGVDLSRIFQISFALTDAVGGTMNGDVRIDKMEWRFQRRVSVHIAASVGVDVAGQVRG